MFKPIVAALAVSVAMPSWAQSQPSQLERQLLRPSEYGKYDHLQLARIKAISELDVSTSEKKRRIRAVKEGGLFDLSIKVGAGVKF